MTRSDPEQNAQRPLLAGLILAAGLSQRMGRPKALLPLGGRPLLAHALEHARNARLDEIVVVLGAEAEEARRVLALDAQPALRCVVNREPGSGQSRSLQLGLAAIDPAAAAAVVLLGDQPEVDAKLIDRVVEAFLAANSLAARPVWGGAGASRVPGHPVVLARKLFAQCARLEGDEGARALFSGHPEWLQEIPQPGEPPLDIDTRQDYERARFARN